MTEGRERERIKTHGLFSLPSIFIFISFFNYSCYDIWRISRKNDYLARKKNWPEEVVEVEVTRRERDGERLPRDNREEIAFGIINYPRKRENG